nr:ammonia-forming cytochrome c nitrite reductase subunit c552 [Chloroflexota bacterium]
MRKSLIRWGLAGAGGLMMVIGLTATRPAQAASSAQAATPAPLTSEECLACHAAPDQTMTLPGGEPLYITVDGEAFASALHGKAGVTCADCHATITAYPHEPLTENNLRDVTVSLSDTCRKCHSDQAAKNMDSVHQKIREGGGVNASNAAACADCHNPHYTQPPAEPRSRIANTCGRCHSGIAQQYRGSVHGTQLTDENNPDVPVCTDCHGVHTIADPRTSQFLLKSPELCAGCHTNKGRMDKYGINTDVLNTYVADFHGTTWALFEQQTPDQLTNKPLCIDCHGVHNIKAVTDQNSSVIRQNLLTTCQKCHPNATANFPEAWLSHYAPSPQHNALVYYVNVFYSIFIPGVLGSMGLFVVSDAGRRIYNRVKGGRK